MKPVVCAILAIALSSCAAAYGQTQRPSAYPTMGPVEKYLMPNAAAEVAMARTAGPASVSARAEILVLKRTGYVVAVEGTNGWTCFVGRAFQGGFDDPEFWSWKNRSAVCLNPPAVQSVLSQYVALAKWALAGATREQLAQKSRAAYASHQFSDPAPGSFSFMLSKESYLNDEVKGPWRPHVMLFIAYNQMNTWAAGFDGSPILVPPAGTYRPYQPMTIDIPVQRWSDGSNAWK